MNRNKKILLVDDEAAIRLTSKRELQRYYQIVLASGYEEALALLTENHFDLLITDLVMPGKNGVDLLKEAKSRCPEMSVIICTGYGDIGTIIETVRAGVDDFLLKPFEIEELVRRIDETFARREGLARLRHYEKICATTGTLIALVDDSGRYLEANGAYLRAYGRKREQLIGCAMAEVVGRSLFDTKIAASLTRCFSGATVQHLDLFRLAGQGVRSMVVAYDPVTMDGGKTVISALISMTDVTSILQDSLDLQRREERLRLAQSISSDGFMDFDRARGTYYYCGNWQKLLGSRPDLPPLPGTSWLALVHPEDSPAAVKAVEDCLLGLTDGYDLELRLHRTDGDWGWFRIRGMVAERDGDRLPQRIIGTLRNIADRKKMQQELLEANRRLEENVAHQTAKLASHNRELTEANAALSVLLKKRQEDREELERSLRENVLRLIEPLVNRLQRTALDDEQLGLLQDIENNLHDITSSFVTSLGHRFAGLTPMEIQVATHVKQGKATKEIADILRLAPDTVNVHRKKIRKKLGLCSKAVNLQTFLASLPEE